MKMILMTNTQEDPGQSEHPGKSRPSVLIYSAVSIDSVRQQAHKSD